YYNNALEIDMRNKNKEAVAQTYNNIANVYSGLNDLQKSEQFYRKAIQIYQDLNEPNKIGSTYVNIASLYTKTSPEKSIQLLDSALQIANRLKDKNLKIHIYKEMGNAYYYMKDYLNAYNVSQWLIQTKDSLFSEDLHNAIAETQTKYEVEKKENENKILRQSAQIKDLQIKNRNYALSIIGTGLIIFIVLVILIYNRYTITQKQKKIIEAQKQVVEEKNREILDSIAYAKRLQDAILPSPKLLSTMLPYHFLLFKPRDIVSGDFYWGEHINDDIYVAVADCTGHGVPGAMVSVVCANALNRSVNEFKIHEPGKILDCAREIVINTFCNQNENVRDGMDISLLRFNSKTLQAQWSGANNPLYIIRNQEVISFKGDRQPVGIFSKASSFTTHNFSLEKGDRVYIFSDGFPDQFGGTKGKKYKSKNLISFLKNTSHLSINEQ
ncbi:MAG: hypothetical protein D6707_06770, partial [Bacteroidetes bacterium]